MQAENAGARPPAKGDGDLFIRRAEEAVRHFQRERNSMSMRIDTLESEQRSLREQLDEGERQARARVREIEQMRATAVASDARIETLVRERQSMVEESNSLASTNRRLESEISSLRVENRDLGDRIREISEERDSVFGQFETILSALNPGMAVPSVAAVPAITALPTPVEAEVSEGVDDDDAGIGELEIGLTDEEIAETTAASDGTVVPVRLSAEEEMAATFEQLDRELVRIARSPEGKEGDGSSSFPSLLRAS